MPLQPRHPAEKRRVGKEHWAEAVRKSKDDLKRRRDGMRHLELQIERARLGVGRTIELLRDIERALARFNGRR